MDNKQNDDYMEFANILLEVVNEELSEDVTALISNVTKNNGVVLTGMTFNQKGINASPTIYLERYYDKYVSGESLDSIASDLISTYSHNKLDESIDVDFFPDYEKVRDKLFCKVINTQLNENLLAGIPSEEYMDLSIVVYCRLDQFGYGPASILIKNDHLKLWEVSTEEVIETAKKNTYKNMEFSINEIGKVLSEFMSEELSAETFCNEMIPMYVATNREKNNGAVGMIFPDTLANFAKEIDDDYYILPSSIHEFIVVPMKVASGCDDYDDMIKSVNESELLREEILSDHAYTYVRGEGIKTFCH